MTDKIFVPEREDDLFARLRNMEKRLVRERRRGRALTGLASVVLIGTLLLSPGSRQVTAQGVGIPAQIAALRAMVEELRMSQGNGIPAQVAALRTRVNQLEVALTAESAARAAADSALQAADTQVRSNAIAEGAAREAADVALGAADSKLRADLDVEIAARQAIVSPFVLQGDTYVLSGYNLQIINGMGATSLTNGTGNLIVGYNEDYGFLRTGSHNIIGGAGNGYSSYGGFVVGQSNQITGPYATVSGGYSNTASGTRASVSGGGSGNTASGDRSTVSGGAFNTAFGAISSVSGGQTNTASGVLSSVSGGWNNTAAGDHSSVLGGQGNTVSSQFGHFP